MSRIDMSIDKLPGMDQIHTVILRNSKGELKKFQSAPGEGGGPHNKSEEVLYLKEENSVKEIYVNEDPTGFRGKEAQLQLGLCNWEGMKGFEKDREEP